MDQQPQPPTIPTNEQNQTSVFVPQQETPPQDGQLYKATVLRRYGAVLLDSLLFIPVYIVLYNLFGKSQDSLVQIIYTLLFWSYNIYFIQKQGATLGKKWLKVRVVNKAGATPTIGQAILRETIGKIVSGFVLGLGYLWAVWDKNRQTWHDKIAGTYVVTPIPNDGKNGCLMWVILSMVLVIPVIAILSVIITFAINPLELTRRSRDTVRMSDLSSLNQSIAIAKEDNSSLKLCGNKPTPCLYTSSENTSRSLKGDGWIPVDLSSAKVLSTSTLPDDPLHDQAHFYMYCSDGKDWEIDAVLESNQQKAKAAADKGDNPNLYEVGSNLTLCPAQ